MNRQRDVIKLVDVTESSQQKQWVDQPISLIQDEKKDISIDPPFNLTLSEQEVLRQNVIEALKEVYDPEIPVNIYDLGLIYSVKVNAQGEVAIEMTLTAPGCPVAHTFPGEVQLSVLKLEQVTRASVELVWDPPWSRDCMSEAAKLMLGLF